MNTLFDLEHVPPIRKGGIDYLLNVAGDYDGYELWALAPIDRYVRDQYIADAATSEFVWLIIDGQFIWALVNLDKRNIIALDPDPIDKTIREQLKVTA